jgi:hypothetical protein
MFKLRSGLFHNEALPDAVFSNVVLVFTRCLLLRLSARNVADSRKKELSKEAALTAKPYYQEPYQQG